MNKFLNLFLLAFVFGGLLMLQSCNKGCLTSTGKETSVSRELSDFNHIQLWDNLDLTLEQSDENSLIITGGEHLLAQIESSLSGEMLVLKNNNRCNFLRSYDKPIQITLKLKNLYELEIHGTGTVICANTIVSDSLMLNVWDASGEVAMNIETKKSVIRYHIGTTIIRYSGKTRLSYVSSNSYGPVYADALESEQTYISTIGSNNNTVWATEILEATIGASGSIYYKGEPKILRTFIEGSGEVAPYNP